MPEFGYTAVDEQMRLEAIINFIRNHPAIPEDINEFEQIFKQFIHKVVEYQSPIIDYLNIIIDRRLEPYKEHIGKKMEGLTMHELAELSPDVDLHTDLEFLSVQVSPLVKAIEILNAFMRIYTIRSIVEWPIRINDKNTVSALVALVSSKISRLQVWVMKILDPLLQT